MAKIPRVRFPEWLYENDYSHIYEEYAKLYHNDEDLMYKHPLIPWIKKEYPKIWEEYEAE